VLQLPPGPDTVKGVTTENRLSSFIAAQSIQPWIAVALYNGWTTYASRTLQVRSVPSLNAVWMIGAITGGTVTDGTQVAFVGSGFPPANIPAALVCGITGQSGNPEYFQQCYVEVETTGNVLLYGLGGVLTSPGHLSINGLYPLDPSP
jgi:hypothetical protein